MTLGVTGGGKKERKERKEEKKERKSQTLQQIMALNAQVNMKLAGVPVDPSFTWSHFNVVDHSVIPPDHSVLI